MQERLPYNSISLKKRFLEVYREFFSNSPSIISSPCYFTWTGGHLSSLGSPIIATKLPLRTYVGLNTTSAGKIICEPLNYYLPESDTFEVGLYNYAKSSQRLRTFLTEWATEKLGTSKFPGCRLRGLLEVPFTRGLGTNSSFAATLAVGLYLHWRLITPEQIEQWQKKTSCELWNEKELLFDEICRFAWKIEFHLFPNRIFGIHGSFPSLITSSTPILYYTGQAEMSEWDLPDTQKNRESMFASIDKIPHFGLRVEDFGQIPGSLQWPVEVAVIYLGNMLGPEDRIERRSLDIDNLLILNKNELHKKLSPYTQVNPTPHFYRILKMSDKKLRAQLLELPAVWAWRIFESIYKILRDGNPEDIDNFLALVNDECALRDALEKGFHLTTRATYFLRSRADEAQISLATTVVGADRDGVLVLTPSVSFARELPDRLKSLETSIHRQLRFDYASWIDGVEEDGVKIEQDLNQQFYSAFISRGVAMLRHYRHGEWTTSLVTVEQLVKERRTILIFFDLPEDHIYLNGKRLTSKELYSATTTIEIILKLLENPGKEVSNSEFPPSSYAEDRNTFSSKILLPFREALEAVAGKGFDFRLSGGLTDFRVLFDPRDLPITVLEKIF